MKKAESMLTGNDVPVENYHEFVRTSREHDFLVCPWCGWEVRYHADGARLRAHFRHLGLKGDVLYKRCREYRAGHAPSGGGDFQPVLEADDRHTLTEVLQGYIIRRLAEDRDHFGAKQRTYMPALHERRHTRLVKETALAGLIAGAAKTSGLAERWSVCTAAFLRFMLASAADDAAAGALANASGSAAGDVRTWRTPFRQVLAYAWSSVVEGMMSELHDIERRMPPYDTVIVEADKVALLRSWIAFMGSPYAKDPDGTLISSRLPPRLAKAVKEAVVAVPVPDGGTLTPAWALTALLVATTLRIAEGLRIDRLIDDPKSVMPTGGYIYVARIYKDANTVRGVKVGRSSNFPRREKAHRTASAGTIPVLDFVRLVDDYEAVEAEIKRQMAAHFPRMKDIKGSATVGTERFVCSLEDAVRVVRRVIYRFEIAAKRRAEGEKRNGARRKTAEATAT